MSGGGLQGQVAGKDLGGRGPLTASLQPEPRAPTCVPVDAASQLSVSAPQARWWERREEEPRLCKTTH